MEEMSDRVCGNVDGAESEIAHLVKSAPLGCTRVDGRAARVDFRLAVGVIMAECEVVDAALDNWDAVVAGREELLDRAMLADIRNLEKYNYIFSDETLQYAYVDEKLDLDGAKRWLEAFQRFALQVC